MATKVRSVGTWSNDSHLLAGSPIRNGLRCCDSGTVLNGLNKLNRPINLNRPDEHLQPLPSFGWMVEAGRWLAP
jgi:hypothetical protein